MHIMQYSEYEVNRPLFKGPSRPASTYSLPELSKINKISQLDSSYSYYSIGPSSWSEMKAKVQLMLLRKREKLKKMFSFDQDDHDWVLEHDLKAKKCCFNKRAEKERRKSMKIEKEMRSNPEITLNLV